MFVNKRATRREIAELSYVLRAILELIAARGGSKGKAHRAALELVDAFVRGDATTPDALKAAREGVAKAVERLGVFSPPVWKALSWVPLGALLQMVERGDDLSELILEHAANAVHSLDPSVEKDHLDTIREQARVYAAAFDDTPLPARALEYVRRAGAAESLLLARSRAALPAEARALFGFAQPERDAGQTTDRTTLVRRLEELGFPVNDAVLAFEETFGGLLLPVTPQDGWRADGLYTLVGPWAMLAAHTSIPRGGKTAASKRLVPVARGTQEDVYFLDEDGAPFYHETIGEPGAVPFGANAAELVTRLVFASLTYASQSQRGIPVFPPAARVASAAAALGLTQLFADDMSQWWYGSAAVVVIFRGQVWGIARTEEAIAVLQG
jgi:hypothetical protein